MAFGGSKQQEGPAPYSVHRVEKRKDQFITSKNTSKERAGKVNVTCG